MSAGTCSSCGAPLPTGSNFCNFCGTAVPGAAAPLASVAPAAAAGTLPTVTSPSPPPRRHRHLFLKIVAVVVVVLVVIAVVVIVFTPPPPAVQVQGINLWAPDNVCGLNANPTGYYGFTANKTQSQTFEFGIPNYNTTTCTVRTFVTNTSGFVITGLVLPDTIGGNGTGYENITVQAPNADFNGYLNFVLG